MLVILHGLNCVTYTSISFLKNQCATFATSSDHLPCLHFLPFFPPDLYMLKCEASYSCIKWAHP